MKNDDHNSDFKKKLLLFSNFVVLFKIIHNMI